MVQQANHLASALAALEVDDRQRLDALRQLRRSDKD